MQILDEKMLQNFLTLSSAASYLSQKKSNTSVCAVRHLLNKFVKNYAKIYGPDKVVYNVHNLLHLPGDYEKYGSIDNNSAYVFENYLGHLKKLIRKPNFVLSQLIHRFEEKSGILFNSTFKRKCDMSEPILSQRHSIGPLTDDNEAYNQFKRLNYAGLTYGINNRDFGVKIGSNIAVIKNILKSENGTVYIMHCI